MCVLPELNQDLSFGSPDALKICRDSSFAILRSQVMSLFQLVDSPDAPLLDRAKFPPIKPRPFEETLPAALAKCPPTYWL